MAGYSASKHAVQVVLHNYLQYLRNYRLFITQGYFDSLRMEVKSDNIDVQMVCPGPIVTNISVNAFSSQLDKVCVLECEGREWVAQNECREVCRTHAGGNG